MTFLSIQQVADLGVISRHEIRKRVKQGKAPGVWCGNKFMINADRFFEQLEEESLAAIKDEKV